MSSGKTTQSRWLYGVGVAALAAGFIVHGTTSEAQAEWQPSGDIEILVTVGEGAGPDRIARMIQSILQNSDIIDQNVTVENRPGGGGAVGWSYLNQHEGDGHHIAVGGASMVTNYLNGNSAIGPDDLTPIVNLIDEYIGIAVQPDSPFETGSDVLDQLEEDPGSLGIGIATSLGNSNNQAIALAAMERGIPLSEMRTAIFSSGGEARTALIGGHLDVVPVSVGSLLGQHEAGDLRVVTVTSPERIPGPVEDVPTWIEQGIDVEVANWRGIIGPRGLSDDQIAFWEDVFTQLVETEEWQEDLRTNERAHVFMLHDEYVEFIDRQANLLRPMLDEMDLLSD